MAADPFCERCAGTGYRFVLGSSRPCECGAAPAAETPPPGFTLRVRPLEERHPQSADEIRALRQEAAESRAALAALRARVDEALDDVLACADSAMWAGKPIGPGAVWAFREVVLAVRAALSGEGR